MPSLALALFAALLFALGAWPAQAKDSLNGVFVGARHYIGKHFDGSLDFSSEQAWTADATFELVHSMLAYEDSETSLVTLGLSHPLDENNNARVAVSFWADTANKIYYVGPTFEYNHLWLNEQSHAETLKLTLDVDLFFYAAAEGDGFTIVSGIPPTVTTTQIHPSLMLEKPLFDFFLTPFVTYGHYFYTTDPAAILDSLSQAAVSFSSISGIYAMTGGFLKNTWTLGSFVSLGQTTRLRGEFGRAQSDLDSSWATIYSVRLEQMLFNYHWRLSLGWNHVSQQNLPVDFGSVGLGCAF